MGVPQVARDVRILQWLEWRERCSRIEIRDRGCECGCINVSLREEVVPTRIETGEKLSSAYEVEGTYPRPESAGAPGWPATKRRD